MDVNPPLEVSPRGISGLRLSNAWISMEFSGDYDDRRAPGFRYFIDLVGGTTVEDDDIYSPAIEGDTEEYVLRRSFAALLCFLLSDSETYRAHMGPVPEGCDPYLFSEAIAEWAYSVDDELSIALAELDGEE